MSDTLEEKIKRLYKYIHENAAFYHSHDLLIQINTELEKGAPIDNEHAKILLNCTDELLKRASEPLHCRCGHELQSHVNFQTGILSGCSLSNNHICDCTTFRLKTN